MATNSNNVTTHAMTSTTSNTEESATWSNDISAVDLRHGGQWGFLPRVGGIRDGKVIEEYMYNQSYVRNNVIPIVLKTPRFFDLFPDKDFWHAAVKALFEVHARNIEGLNSSLTVNVEDRETGLSGAVFSQPTQVVRENTNVSVTLHERYGIPFEILLDVWVRYGILDPDTRAPLVTTLSGAADIGVYTPEWFTATVLFIEPDPLLRTSYHTWLVSNLFPRANPDIIGSKNQKDPKTIKDITVEFGGMALPPTNKTVMDLGNTVLDSLKLYEKSPDDILVPADKVSSILSSFTDLNVYYQNGAQNA